MQTRLFPSSSLLSGALNTIRKPQASPGVKTGASVSLSLPVDQFVRFGSETPGVDAAKPMSLSSKPFDSEFTQKMVDKINQAMKSEPGGKYITEYLKRWKDYGEYNDKMLLTSCQDHLEHLFQCNEAPRETILKALDAGLAQLMDEAIERQFSTEFPRTFFVQMENISFHHMGRMGSKRFLPVLESYLKAGDDDQKSSAMGALSYMSCGFNYETSMAARKLLARYKSVKEDLAYKQIENEEINYYAAIHTMVEAATPRAVNLVAGIWDRITTSDRELKATSDALKMTLKALETTTEPDAKRVLIQQIKLGVEKLSEKGIYDYGSRQGEEVTDWPAKGKAMVDGAEKRLAEVTRNLRPVIEGLMGLVAKNAPGALAAVEARKPAIVAHLDNAITNPGDHDFGGKEMDTLLKAALFGQSLDELPPVIDFINSTQYSQSDLRTFQMFPEALTAMELRGVAGAGEMKTRIQNQLDAFIISELEKPLKPSTNPEQPRTFQDYWFREYRNLGVFAGSAAIIPVFERLLNEPWAPIDSRYNHNLWSSGGEWYTQDKTELVRKQQLPQIQHALDDLKERLGLL